MKNRNLLKLSFGLFAIMLVFFAGCSKNVQDEKSIDSQFKTIVENNESYVESEVNLTVESEFIADDVEIGELI